VATTLLDAFPLLAPGRGSFVAPASTSWLAAEVEAPPESIQLSKAAIIVGSTRSSD
jgi:hypothetical protein